MMNRPWEGKAVLVTGASTGIGRATALAFARAGARVVAASRGPAVDNLAAEIREAGGEATALRVDVRNGAAVEAMVRDAVAVYGRVDCAVNNAGIAGKARSVWTCSEAEFDDVIATNLRGVWLCMKHEIAQMRTQGGGAIVNMASVAGLAGVRGAGAYTAAKHGVIGLTRVAALEHAREHIRINAVCPGVVRHTAISDRAERAAPEYFQQMVDLHPNGRASEPEEVAEAVLWLGSTASGGVTGIALPVDGGALAGR